MTAGPLLPLAPLVVRVRAEPPPRSTTTVAFAVIVPVLLEFTTSVHWPLASRLSSAAPGSLSSSQVLAVASSWMSPASRPAPGVNVQLTSPVVAGTKAPPVDCVVETVNVC